MTNPLNAFALAAVALVLTPLAGAGTAYAAASLAPSLFSAPPSLVQRAECEDECQDFMEAREQAVEARQDAAHDAAELRDEYGSRASQRDASKRAAAKDAEQATGNPVATAKTETPAKVDKITTADTSEPKTVQKIVEKAMVGETAVDTDTPAKSSPKGCKQYFPTIGMTLSVPCEK